MRRCQLPPLTIPAPSLNSLLFIQLKALRQENVRLNEHKGKSRWDDKPAAQAQAASHQSDDKLKPAAKRDREDAAVATTAESANHAGGPASEPPPVDGYDALQATAVARCRSLFSLGISLAVGAVAWSADAPCLPLLAGLFAVVAVSMRSVSRLRRRAGDDGAVALLGLNWFLLGLLTSPMLPAALGPALTWLAATAPL